MELQNLKIRTICQTKNKTAILPNPCYQQLMGWLLYLLLNLQKTVGIQYIVVVVLIAHLMLIWLEVMDMAHFGFRSVMCGWSIADNGTRLKCRFNALLADVMLSFCVGRIN